MANHISAEKRARQALKRNSRNNQVKSQVHSVERKVRGITKDPKSVQSALSEAFSVLQKSRGILHKNAIKRRMARLAKAAALVK